jgi:hypothetical protein
MAQRFHTRLTERGVRQLALISSVPLLLVLLAALRTRTASLEVRRAVSRREALLPEQERRLEQTANDLATLNEVATAKDVSALLSLQERRVENPLGPRVSPVIAAPGVRSAVPVSAPRMRYSSGISKDTPDERARALRLEPTELPEVPDFGGRE